MRKRLNRILVSDKGDEGEQALLLPCVGGGLCLSIAAWETERRPTYRGRCLLPTYAFSFVPIPHPRKVDTSERSVRWMAVDRFGPEVMGGPGW